MLFSRHFKLTIFFVLPIIAFLTFGGIFVYKKITLAGHTNITGTCSPTSVADTDTTTSITFTATGGGSFSNISQVGVNGVNATLVSQNATEFVFRLGSGTPTGSATLVITDDGAVTTTCGLTITSGSGQAEQPRRGESGQAANTGVPDSQGLLTVIKFLYKAVYDAISNTLDVTGANFSFNTEDVKNNFSLQNNGQKADIAANKVAIESNTKAKISLDGLADFLINGKLAPGNYTLNLFVSGQKEQPNIKFTVEAFDEDPPAIFISQHSDGSQIFENPKFLYWRVEEKKENDSGAGDIKILHPDEYSLNVSKHSPLTIALNLKGFGRLDVLSPSGGVIFSNAVGPNMLPISIPNTENGTFIIRLYDDGNIVFEISAVLQAGKLISLESKNYPLDHSMFNIAQKQDSKIFVVKAIDNAGNENSASLIFEKAIEEEGVIEEVIIEFEEVEEEADDFTFFLRRPEPDLSFTLGKTRDFTLWLEPKGQLAAEDIFDINIEDSTPPGEERIKEEPSPPTPLSQINVSIEEIEEAEVIGEAVAEPPFEVIVEEVIEEGDVSRINVEIFEEESPISIHDADISAGWASYKRNKKNWPANHSVEYSKSWVGLPAEKTANWPANHHVAASNLGNFR
jgi:hypothetical protein